MNFEGLQARYNRLYQESPSWKLLRTTNSVYILAFMEEIFTEENEIPFARARVALEADLELANEKGFWETETPASTYLSQWTDEGWLRDMNGRLSMTDASEQALRFAKSLTNRVVTTSASHLKIVQDNVRDLSIRLSTSPEFRIARLEEQIASLERDIEQLRIGHIQELSENQQREAMRELYQQASILSGDFRRVEDDMREMDQTIRVEMIQNVTRGEILGKVLDYEQRLKETESGSAFYSFHELLQDENRAIEFRNELQNILTTPAAKLLSIQQQSALKYLIRNLNRESDRVLNVRRLHSQGLRSFIESGAALETQAVNRLISQIEKKAITLRDQGVAASQKIGLALPIGKAEVSSPTTIRLKHPDDKIDTSGVEEHDTQGVPSSSILDAVQTIQIIEIAKGVKKLVLEEGPMTIASICELSPVHKGLEELTALVRVARAIRATELHGEEIVYFEDNNGIRLQATMPKFLIDASLFPEDIGALNL